MRMERALLSSHEWFKEWETQYCSFVQPTEPTHLCGMSVLSLLLLQFGIFVFSPTALVSVSFERSWKILFMKSYMR